MSKDYSYNVLVVDDESSILTVLAWVMRDLGCTVTTARGGHDALSIMENRSFDLLITDLIMPEGDGFFLLRMAERMNPRMKVIIVTGSPDLLSQVLAMGGRVDGFLAKPFGLNVLRRLVSNCLDGQSVNTGREAKYALN